ncbi:MAG: YggT family protein [Candidatus Phosphoribacter sp.]|nr:YggT family protein [Actinomycetales bacterium]
MRSIWQVISTLLFLFFVFLIGRLVLDWVRVLARQWRPRGAVLVVAEAIYSVTDPPIRLVRKVIPPLTLGGIRIDLAFIVLFLLTSMLMSLQPF